jgi:hypothetical protein
MSRLRRADAFSPVDFNPKRGQIRGGTSHFRVERDIERDRGKAGWRLHKGASATPVCRLAQMPTLTLILAIEKAEAKPEQKTLGEMFLDWIVGGVGLLLMAVGKKF